MLRLHLEVRINHTHPILADSVYTLSTSSYFRHYLNWVILYSVWFEFDLMPFVFSRPLLFQRGDPTLLSSETSKRWSPDEGVWMVWWMRYQILMPLVLLQALNLFWYFLIWRVAFRYVMRPTIVVPELTYVHFVGLLATSASQTCGRTTKMMARRTVLMTRKTRETTCDA